MGEGYKWLKKEIRKAAQQNMDLLRNKVGNEDQPFELIELDNTRTKGTLPNQAVVNTSLIGSIRDVGLGFKQDNENYIVLGDPVNFVNNDKLGFHYIILNNFSDPDPEKRLVLKKATTSKLYVLPFNLINFNPPSGATGPIFRLVRISENGKHLALIKYQRILNTPSPELFQGINCPSVGFSNLRDNLYFSILILKNFTLKEQDNLVNSDNQLSANFFIDANQFPSDNSIFPPLSETCTLLNQYVFKGLESGGSKNINYYTEKSNNEFHHIIELIGRYDSFSERNIRCVNPVFNEITCRIESSRVHITPPSFFTAIYLIKMNINTGEISYKHKNFNDFYTIAGLSGYTSLFSSSGAIDLFMYFTYKSKFSFVIVPQVGNNFFTTTTHFRCDASGGTISIDEFKSESVKTNRYINFNNQFFKTEPSTNSDFEGITKNFLQLNIKENTTVRLIETNLTNDYDKYNLYKQDGNIFKKQSSFKLIPHSSALYFGDGVYALVGQR